MRPFVVLYFERIKAVMLALGDRKFFGKLTIEVDFKDGGVVDVYITPRERIVLTASK